MRARFAVAAKTSPVPEVHVRADKATRYERVAFVMSAAQQAGLVKIGFVTEPVALRRHALSQHSVSASASLLVQPRKQWLPLVSVLGNAAGCDVPQCQSLRRQVDIILRIAQISDDRYPEAVDKPM